MKKLLYLFILVSTIANPVFPQFPDDTISQQVKRIYTEIGSVDFYSVFQVVLAESRADNAEVGGEYGGEIPDYDPYMFYGPSENTYALLRHWFRGYTIISICNSIIESVPESDLDITIKERYIAETKFIRSLVIFTLVNTFEAIPYPLETFYWPLGDNFNDYYMSNKVTGEVKSLYEIYEQIETDLLEVIEVLPYRSQLDNENIYRATKGAAKALLGKVLLYGSCFADNYPDDPRFEGFTTQRVSDALSYLEDVINSGEYALLNGEFNTWWDGSPLYPDMTPAYRALFNASQNQSEESVFAATNVLLGEGWQPNRGLAHTMYSTVRHFNMDESEQNFAWGINYPSQYLVDAFAQETGTDATDDPRFAVTVGQEGDSVLTRYGWYPMTFKNNVNAANRKWECSPEEFWNGMSTYVDSPLDFPIIRYADVLLLAAEASLLTGNANKALDYTNMVRQRARESGQTGKPEDLTTVTAEDIMLERRVELALEGHRFYDLLRWGLLTETLDGKYITSFDSTANFIEGEHEFIHYSDTLLSVPSLVKNTISEDHLILFPNPGNGKVYIQSDELITDLIVNTIQGKQIYAIKGVHNFELSIDLSGIESGIYFITLKNINGSAIRRYIKL